MTWQTTCAADGASDTLTGAVLLVSEAGLGRIRGPLDGIKQRFWRTKYL